MSGVRRVDRVSAADMTQLATDVGPVAMNVAAAMVLHQLPDAEWARRELADRCSAVPRLTQRLVRVPRGLGRPMWVDDPALDAADQITIVPCPPPGDRQAFLDLASDATVRPLPTSRPLWRALLVPGLADGGVGLVLVLHHVLADGIGGLALLAALAGPPSNAARRLLRPAPTRGQLAIDRVASLGLRERPRGRLREAVAELGRQRTGSAPRCSLNVPTGPRRQVTAADVGLAEVRAAAHRHSATVNDVLLVAVTAALEHVLAGRGEQVPHLVVSVPVSARRATTVEHLGNQVGVMPVAVPLTGTLPERLAVVAQATAEHGETGRGASAALLDPAFRALAAVGAFGPLVNRQHLVNTFLTNLRGPDQPLPLLGTTIRSITPITTTAGNVTTAFAALSYAGTLTVSIISDPDRVPEHAVTAAALGAALRGLTVA
jgi:WS/DGAT/MGAT family acyltransferase